jgi:hypothetical protein
MDLPEKPEFLKKATDKHKLRPRNKQGKVIYGVEIPLSAQNAAARNCQCTHPRLVRCVKQVGSIIDGSITGDFLCSGCHKRTYVIWDARSGKIESVEASPYRPPLNYIRTKKQEQSEQLEKLKIEEIETKKEGLMDEFFDRY